MIRRDEFAVSIWYDNKPYTPEEVLKYVGAAQTDQFGDKEEFKKLRSSSLTKAREIINKYGLKNPQILTKESSEAGNSLAELVLQHCDAGIDLIVMGGARFGILI